MTQFGVRYFMDRGLEVDGSHTYPALDGGDPIFIPAPVDPPPPDGTMYVGASIQNSNSLLATDESQLGAPLGIIRAYDTNFPTTYNNSKASLGDNSHPMVISHVFDTLQMASGALDAQYNNILDGAPAGRKIWWCVGRHEADAKINQNQLGAADINDHKAAMRRMADMVHARGNANWKTVSITTMQPWDPPGSHAYAVGDFWLPGYTDLWTVDKFNPIKNPVAGGTYRPLSDFIGDAVNYFHTHSIPWGITETNTPEVTGSPQSKSNWITNSVDYAFNNGAVMYCYWDKAFGSDTDKTARRLASSTTALHAFSVAMAKYNP